MVFLTFDEKHDDNYTRPKGQNNIICLLYTCLVSSVYIRGARALTIAGRYRKVLNVKVNFSEQFYDFPSVTETTCRESTSQMFTRFFNFLFYSLLKFINQGSLFLIRDKRR